MLQIIGIFCTITSSSSTMTAMRWMSVPLRSPYTSRISKGVGLGQLSLWSSSYCLPQHLASIFHLPQKRLKV